VPAGILVLALPVGAQIKFGETTASASGIISSGYTATYGNMTSSTHGWTFGGSGTFSGSYHDPNFLSFNISPYLNQSRANSNFQSISNSSGVTASANLFSGSHFPGSISYSEAYDSDGNYGIPGLLNYVTHGNSDTFGITWNENLPNAPSFSAGFQKGSSNYSVYGTHDDGQNSFHSLNLHSGYRWEGFTMGAYYTNGGSHSDIPEIVAGEITKIDSSTNAIGVNVGHMLPMQGSFSAAVNRSHWDTSYLGYSSTGTVDTINSIASMHPRQKVSLTGTLNYSDNLAGQLTEAIISSGAQVSGGSAAQASSGNSSNESSNSLDLMGVAAYTPVDSLQTSAFVERRSQSYQGENYAVNSYGGAANYAHHLLKGSYSGGFSLTANRSDQNGQDTLGFSTNNSYTSEVAGWHLTGAFGYAQNMQTMLVTYTNSYYYYSGNVRRRWGQFNFNAGAGGSHTAITDNAGTSSHSESYDAGIGYGIWIEANGNYSKSDGQALITGSGLVPVPIPSPIVPSGILSLYGGDSYSFAVASTPVKRLILSAGWSKALTNTSSTKTDTGTTATASNNQTSQFNTLVQYQVRKLYFTSGYARLEQGFSSSGNKSEIISSYYMGLSRWFNFF
jgi:hypothetical protein